MKTVYVVTINGIVRGVFDCYSDAMTSITTSYSKLEYRRFDAECSPGHHATTIVFKKHGREVINHVWVEPMTLETEPTHL